MFARRSYCFTKLFKSYPIFRLIDIYDRQSFIRVHVLDNVFVCIFMYFLLYIALWYSNKVIKKIEKSNDEYSVIVKENQTKLNDLVILKKKKIEYEEVMVRSKGVQKVTNEQLENEMKKLSVILLSTTSKMKEIEKCVEKLERSQRNYILSTDVGIREIENDAEGKDATGEPFEEIKILEPSFPPSKPPEPPPRKYGIFASRPFSGATAEITIAPQNKIGFK